jgi:GxxExxY protein
MLTEKKINQLSHEVIGAAIEVHKELGSGLLESVYAACMEFELQARSLSYVKELKVPVNYKGHLMSTDYRCDFLVENCLVIELKACEAVIPAVDAQVLTYMKLLQVPKGIIINFHVPNIFQYGQKTLVNELFRKLPDE